MTTIGSALGNNVDVLIIGSGPVGSAIARTLADVRPDLDVLMVEEGPVISDPPGRHVKTISDLDVRLAAQIASQGPAQHDYGKVDRLAVAGDNARHMLSARPGTFLVGELASLPGEDGMPAAAMSTNVGGMGAHWTCACPVPGDGERIEFIPREEFDDLFAEAWRLLRVTQHAFDGAPLAKEVRAVLGEALNEGRDPDRQVQAMPLGLVQSEDGLRHWTGPAEVLGDLVTSPQDNFELRPGTIAFKVIVEGGRAIGAQLRDFATEDDYLVSASAVIVAGDSFRTPQLLWASGIRPEALGRYLNDHPQAMGLALLSDHLIPDDLRGVEYTRADAVDAFTGVNWIPYDRDTLPFHGQIMQLDASPVPLTDIDEPVPGSIVGIGMFAAKDLQPEDRLEFSEDELDHRGLPAFSIHYTLTEKDHATMSAMTEAIDRLVNIVGSSATGEKARALPSGSSLHYMGTFRMGEADDGTSVCDRHGAVWGVDGLFVAGNGIIPTPTACNPTATSVALAVGTAQHIARQLPTGNGAPSSTA